MTAQQKIAKLQTDVAALKKTLGTLIAWMASSANSPIRPDEATTLLNKLDV